MPADKHWKKTERKGAAFFGTQRTPLSGSNSGHNTMSDSLHEVLYLEGKSTKPNVSRRTWLHQLWDLWKDTNTKASLEFKVPVLHLHMRNQEGFLIVVNSTDMPKVVEEYLLARGISLDADDIPTKPE